jgi:hypothetical protein
VNIKFPAFSLGADLPEEILKKISGPDKFKMGAGHGSAGKGASGLCQGQGHSSRGDAGAAKAAEKAVAGKCFKTFFEMLHDLNAS